MEKPVQPNILIIKTDQHRYDLAGFMGHEIVRTPNLDALAADSLVCENAFCTSPLCVPSRTSFFTGNYVHRTGATGNGPDCHIKLDQGCLLDPLRAAGYRLSLVGKNHAFRGDYAEANFDTWEEYQHWGKSAGTNCEAFPEVKAFRMNETRFPGVDCSMGLMEGLIEGPEPFPQEHCVTSRIADDGIAFIGEGKEDPFCLHLSFPDPHWPNVVCEPYHSMYDPESLPDLPAVEMDWEGHPFAHYVQSLAYGFDKYTELETKRVVAALYGQITFIDTVLGRVFDHLRATGQYDNTLIVFTSDHGDFTGNYNLVAKTKAFYDSLIRIPLAIKLPGGEHAGRVAAQISNIDVMPTVLEALGMESVSVQGRSFLPVLKGERDEHRKAIFAELGAPKDPPPPMAREDFLKYQEERLREDGIFWFIDYTVNGRAAMIRTEGWKYVYYTGDCEELYHVDADPLELTNLASDPAHRGKRDELHNRLTEWLLTEPLS
jgi:arylsulfatase A-like enzyme